MQEPASIVSVIIPSAREKAVLKTVEALLLQEEYEESLEIIVVSPSPEVEQAFAATSVTVVTVDRLYPPGKMRNIGYEKSQGRYLAFIDDDCIPASFWLSTLMGELLADETLGAVGCRVISVENSYWNRCADYSLFAAYQYQNRKYIELGSAAIVVESEAFRAVDGFDDSLYASEDWDFSLKLKAGGWKCLFTPNTYVYHDHGRGSFSAIMENSLKSGIRSGLLVQSRHRIQLSALAKLSVSFKSPFAYWMLIIPYSLLTTFSLLKTCIRKSPQVAAFIPVLLISRLAYHCGVNIRLFKDTLRGDK